MSIPRSIVPTLIRLITVLAVAPYQKLYVVLVASAGNFGDTTMGLVGDILNRGSVFYTGHVKELDVLSE